MTIKKEEKVENISEELQNEEFIKERILKANAELDQFLCTIQTVSHDIKTIPEKQQRTLRFAYEQADNAEKFAVATIIRGALKHNRVFFCTSKDTLTDAVKNDPDNRMPTTPNLKRINVALRKYGIQQLWDGVRGGARTAAGFCVYAPEILSLFSLEKQDYMKQFQELRAYCHNNWVTNDMVFDLDGNIIIEPEIHQKRIENRRNEKSLKKIIEDYFKDFKDKSFLTDEQVRQVTYYEEVYKKSAEHFQDLLDWLDNPVKPNVPNIVTNGYS